MIAQELIEEQQVSISRACRILNLSRTVFHYKSQKDDQQLIEALLQKVEAHPTEGFWKLFGRLQHEGKGWNHKKVYRVYASLKLNIKKKRRKSPPLRLKELLQMPSELNHTWSIDFASSALLPSDPQSEGDGFRTFHVLDECSREFLRIEVEYTLEGERILSVLQQLVQARAKPKFLTVDYDPKLAASYLEEWGQANEVKILFIQPDQYPQQAFLERPKDIFKKSVLEAYLFGTLEAVRKVTKNWIEYYNSTLPQDALEGATPSQYAQEKRRKRLHPD